MTSTKLYLTFISFVIPFLHLLAADIIELKSGEVLEGKILREDEKEIVIEYRITESILDERKIEKSEVVKIQRQPEDLQVFTKLESLALPAEPIGPEDYQTYIHEHTKFLEKYPYSSKVRTVRERIEKANTEIQQLATGGIKIAGIVLSEEEARLAGISSEEREKLKRIRAAAAKNLHRDVLNLTAAWEKMDAGSPALAEAMRTAANSARKLRSKLEFDIRNHPVIEAKWKESIAQASENDRRRVVEMLEEQQRTLAEELKKSKEAAERIPAFASHDLKSMQAALAELDKEETRLKGLNLSNRYSSLEKTIEGAEAAAKAEWVKALEAARKALELWPENRGAKSLETECLSKMGKNS
ncbi:MAG: hypothetical protein N2035_06555 [Chthoniobacterales bacterium]|nr:hypothetical protein [Chthoniobacterales bacterium]